MDNQLWYNKYRPKTIDEYVWANAEYKEKFQHWVQNPGIMPHMILSGPPGTGKTSLAMLLNEVLELERTDYLFVDASIKTSIDDIRTNVIDFCENTGWSGLKLVVLDEAERISKSGQDSLKGVMNRYGNYTKFVFTTNNISNISDGIKSRARTINITEMDEERFNERLYDILINEKINVDPDHVVSILNSIKEYCYPDLRKAIDLLQDRLVGNAIVEEESIDLEEIVLKVLGEPNDVISCRDMITKLTVNEMEGIYRFLYENIIDVLPNSAVRKEVVKDIALHLDMHGRSAFPDITLTDLLLNVAEMVNKNV